MFTFFLVSLFLVPADDSAWPGFLGDGRTAIDPATLPLKWSPTENIAWTAALPGHGQSSPIIVGDLVYVTSVEGPMKDENIVTALNLTSGEIVWQKRFPAALHPHRWQTLREWSLTLKAVISSPLHRMEQYAGRSRWPPSMASHKTIMVSEHRQCRPTTVSSCWSIIWDRLT